jgi:hypothetical protein
MSKSKILDEGINQYVHLPEFEQEIFFMNLQFEFDSRIIIIICNKCVVLAKSVHHTGHLWFVCRFCVSIKIISTKKLLISI